MRRTLKAERRDHKKVIRKKYSHACKDCGKRLSLYRVRIRVKRKSKGWTRMRLSRDHDLCGQCRRSLGNSIHTLIRWGDLH